MPLWIKHRRFPIVIEGKTKAQWLKELESCGLFKELFPKLIQLHGICDYMLHYFWCPWLTAGHDHRNPNINITNHNFRHRSKFHSATSKILRRQFLWHSAKQANRRSPDFRGASMTQRYICHRCGEYSCLIYNSQKTAPVTIPIPCGENKKC